MNVFVARQTIFNRQKKLFAYEFLHRGSMDNAFPGTDGDKVTSSVPVNTFLSIGLTRNTALRCYVSWCTLCALLM